MFVTPSPNMFARCVVLIRCLPIPSEKKEGPDRSRLIQVPAAWVALPRQEVHLIRGSGDSFSWKLRVSCWNEKTCFSQMVHGDNLDMFCSCLPGSGSLPCATRVQRCAAMRSTSSIDRGLPSQEGACVKDQVQDRCGEVTTKLGLCYEGGLWLGQGAIETGQPSCLA